MTPQQPVTALTHALRELVWGIDSQVAVITNLCQLIDEHVGALNALRTELAVRLERLDVLRAEADDADLAGFLDDLIQVELPAAAEHFPDRIYA